MEDSFYIPLHAPTDITRIGSATVTLDVSLTEDELTRNVTSRATTIFDASKLETEIIWNVVQQVSEKFDSDAISDAFIAVTNAWEGEALPEPSTQSVLPGQLMLDDLSPPEDIGTVTISLQTSFFRGEDTARNIEVEINGTANAQSTQTVGFADPQWESAAIAGLVALLAKQGRDKEEIRKALIGVWGSYDAIYEAATEGAEQ